MEPNVVFLYKIETQNYVTVSDLNENGEWQTYELEHEDEFEMFNHEESNPLEGKGYAIKQSDVCIWPLRNVVNGRIIFGLKISHNVQELHKILYIVAYLL